MKTCAHCRETKPLDAFARNASKPDGRDHRCRDCYRAYAAERRKRPGVAKRAVDTTLAYRARDPEGWRAYSAAHSRVKHVRGRAADHGVCSSPTCSRPARDWALDRSHPSVVCSALYVWSDDIAAYRPMCRSCNKTEDFAARRNSANT